MMSFSYCNLFVSLSTTKQIPLVLSYLTESNHRKDISPKLGKVTKNNLDGEIALQARDKIY